MRSSLTIDHAHHRHEHHETTEEKDSAVIIKALGRVYDVCVSNRKGVNQVADLFRAKKYANKKAQEGVPNKMQVSGDLDAFKKLAKGDEATVEALTQAVADALKA